jgi:hypothetical protein
MSAYDAPANFAGPFVVVGCGGVPLQPMTDSASQLSIAARALSGALEPFVGSVYFSPECHANYVKLGFDPSVNRAGEVALPDGPAYFTSRGSVMGQVPGEVVAAAFAVFNPQAVVPSVTRGWSLTDAATICAARTDGAVGQLTRILGAKPEGLAEVIEALQRAVDALRVEARPLFAGVLSQGRPTGDLATAWWLGDCLREYRGDSHNAAWISAGLTAVEIGLLTELWWGIPIHTYVRTRAWSDADVAEALDNLASRGFLQDRAFTDAGRAFRSDIETATDLQMARAISAMGKDFDAVCRILNHWSTDVRSGHGYLAAGPMDLASRA